MLTSNKANETKYLHLLNARLNKALIKAW